MLELKQLRYFARVAEMGSISKAAAALSIAQPAISRHITNLERDLGVTLFFRNGRGVSLTEAGRTLHYRARAILEEVDRAEQEVRDLTGLLSGQVTLGAPPTVAQVFVVPLIKRLRERAPGISLQVTEAFSGYVNEWLASGRLDVAVLYNAPRTRHLITEELLRETLFLVASPGAAADLEGAAADPVALAAVAALPLILPSRPHGLRLLIDEISGKSGVGLAVDLEIDALSVIKELVEAGVGATILPFASVHREVAAGRLTARPIVEPVFSRSLVLATSHQRPLTLSSRAVLRELKTVVRGLVADGTWQGADNSGTARVD